MTAAAVASFAVFGVFTSLSPTLLAATLHESSHTIAGRWPSRPSPEVLAQIALSRTVMRFTLRVSSLVLVPVLSEHRAQVAG